MQHHLIRWQAGTGVLVAVFVLAHLINTWLAIAGPAAYDAVQRQLGAVYQYPLFEALLLAALYLHLGIGVLRVVRERGRSLSARARWHRRAGVFLAIVITGHILAVRGASWFADVWPRFDGIAFTMAYLPWVFIPYYFVLAMAGFYHAVNGLALGLPRLGLMPGRLTEVALGRMTAIAGVFTGLAIAAFAGVFFDVGDVLRSDFAELALGVIGATTP